MTASTGPGDMTKPAEPFAPIVLPEATGRQWADSLASLVSAILSPPVLAVSMIVIAAAFVGTSVAWRWAGASLMTSVLAPIGYLLWLHRRGMVSDLDVQCRKERFRPLVFTLAALAATTALLWFSAAPAIIRGLAAAHLAQTALVLAITLRWKISMHGATSAACVALLLYVAGPSAASALAALPLVAWSRIRLHRHTPAQTIAGAALGGVVMWSALHWAVASFAP